MHLWNVLLRNRFDISGLQNQRSTLCLHEMSFLHLDRSMNCSSHITSIFPKPLRSLPTGRHLIYGLTSNCAMNLFCLIHRAFKSALGSLAVNVSNKWWHGNALCKNNSSIPLGLQEGHQGLTRGTRYGKVCVKRLTNESGNKVTVGLHIGELRRMMKTVLWDNRLLWMVVILV
jgi:hypothetical protein